MSDSIPASSAPEFAVAMRGYDRLQVETYLDRLRDQLDECTSRLRLTEERAAATMRERNARITELEEQLSTVEQRRLDETAPTFTALGTRIAQMLDLASAEALTIKERARRDAEDILDEARRRREELDHENATGRERLQRQLHELRDTVGALLGVPAEQVVARSGAGGGAGSDGSPDGSPDGSTEGGAPTQAMAEPFPDEELAR